MSLTATALFAEVGSKRMGSLPFNAVRMTMSLAMLALTLWLTMGYPYPRYTDGATWLWLVISGIVGYTIGDYCLMQGYIMIGSRFGQLFMTLSAPTAAIVGWLLLGENMSTLAIIGMFVTLCGIAISILSKPQNGHFQTKLPSKGIFFAVMAGVCQGVGLVISKMGMEHYYTSLQIHGLTPDFTPSYALVPLPLNISIPFAATMIRGMIGLAGFLLLLFLCSKDAILQLRHAIADRKAMWAAALSMLFGPFLGVSLSLLATLYTSTGIAQTLFALTPVLIIAPYALIHKQKISVKEVIGTLITMVGVALFFLV